ncbi:MAG: branched-chain amino acid transport system ATP-binding protein [Thermoanaerobacteraceae bacterium]|nr:branched-chain amino acid transport system ATP-binding protein [Thermoanaerobacteraceae bacterium]
MILKITDLNVFHGPIHAIKKVNLHVKEGEIVAIIGANGAGKTTLLNTIAGLKKKTDGEILYQGEPLPEKSHEVLKKGIALCPEGRRVFGNLTVYENLIMGGYLMKYKKDFEKEVEAVYHIFPRLHERRNQIASTLSGGEQQMLAIGRALMSKPRLFLLDEPSLGLAPLLVQEIFNKFIEINQMGVSILIVEQNAKHALMLSSRAYVLQTGNVIKEGPSKNLLNDPQIQEAYLGKRLKDRQNQ